MDAAMAMEDAKLKVGNRRNMSTTGSSGDLPTAGVGAHPNQAAVAVVATYDRKNMEAAWKSAKGRSKPPTGQPSQ